MTRSIHLRFGKLPSGLACYPRLVLTHRPPITEVKDPPEFHAHVERVVLSAADMRRYARSCGFVATDGVPATYPHILATPLHLKIFATEAFPLRPMGLIHVSNHIEVLGKLSAGMAVAVDVALRSYCKTEAGMTFDLESRLSSAGRVLWRETSVFLSRWPEAVAKKSATRPSRPPKAPKDAHVLEELDVSRRTAWDYARVSDDYNPIHLSDRAARFFGLRGAISHGMWSLARSISIGARAVPERTRIDAQFLTPMQLPSKVVLKEWSEDGARRRALCDVRTGRVLLYTSWTATSA
ncbi:MAG TPA: MaoC/PaaZ C-terminal domain-containing protein [Steroidobacteraceae bacterium]